MVTVDTIVSLLLSPSLLCLGIAISLYLNIAYKRRGPWEKFGSDDIALITGGSNGLGLEISKLLIEKGVTVISLDIVEPVEKLESDKFRFFHCELANEEQLLATITKIKADIGIPTILINNAAIRHSESLIQLSYSKIQDVFQINTMSQVVLLKEILKDITGSHRLYVVTMASILGLVSPSHLSVYSASKAAIISLHDSLSHEIQNSRIRFLLVTPGQLDTRLFKDVKPPRQFLAPVIHAKDLAIQIVEKIDLGERGTLHGPLYTYFIPILRMLPYAFNEFARAFSQMDTSVTDN